ncbi:MAG TPA: SUF system NifU family Fe-S cluster assembly protein [Vicinamibacterales bacterium]|nr:SUF system NifU family Fe-S cluster assembly protein [Vicinamibacterales bacterium]
MNADLAALYQSVILDHNRRPRNFRALDNARRAEGHNPLCGDRLTVFVRIENGVVEEAAFQGFGCAIATASASMMTDSIAGRTVADACALAARLEALLSPEGNGAADDLGSLTALAGVRQFPLRIRCATLPWQAFIAAIRTPSSYV